jgi:hypothetical protein
MLVLCYQRFYKMERQSHEMWQDQTTETKTAPNQKREFEVKIVKNVIVSDR